ncbi:MAG TPA: hypothetical protein VIR57_17725 [Chloroflexota bacterium]
MSINGPHEREGLRVPADLDDQLVAGDRLPLGLQQRGQHQVLGEREIEAAALCPSRWTGEVELQAAEHEPLRGAEPVTAQKEAYSPGEIRCPLTCGSEVVGAQQEGYSLGE